MKCNISTQLAQTGKEIWKIHQQHEILNKHEYKTQHESNSHTDSGFTQKSLQLSYRIIAFSQNETLIITVFDSRVKQGGDEKVHREYIQ